METNLPKKSFSHLLLLAPKICLCCLNVLISHFLNINQPTHSELHKELWHPSAARPSSPQLIEMSVDPDTVKSFPKTYGILEGNPISVLQQAGSLLSCRLTEAVALQAFFDVHISRRLSQQLVL